MKDTISSLEQLRVLKETFKHEIRTLGEFSDLLTALRFRIENTKKTFPWLPDSLVFCVSMVRITVKHNPMNEKYLETWMNSSGLTTRLNYYMKRMEHEKKEIDKK